MALVEVIICCKSIAKVYSRTTAQKFISARFIRKLVLANSSNIVTKNAKHHFDMEEI